MKTEAPHKKAQAIWVKKSAILWRLELPQDGPNVVAIVGRSNGTWRWEHWPWNGGQGRENDLEEAKRLAGANWFTSVEEKCGCCEKPVSDCGCIGKTIRGAVKSVKRSARVIHCPNCGCLAGQSDECSIRAEAVITALLSACEAIVERDLLRPCNPQDPALLKFDRCPKDHTNCCGACEMRYQVEAAIKMATDRYK